MANRKQLLEIEKLKGGLNSDDQLKIDGFFVELAKRVNGSRNRYLLYNHYIDGFEYYLDHGYLVDQIIQLLNLNNLGDFYEENKREYYGLDNAAIVYPLGMRYGQMPLFRLSCELNDEVEPCLLQLAVDFTIKRFPAYAAVIKSGFYWHYLETVNNVHVVEEEKDIPCKPISIILRSQRSLRVFYYKKRISVEFFHVLCDGSGGMIFLKTLLGQYLKLKGADIGYDKGVLDVNGEIDKEELNNEFVNAPGDSDFGTFVDKKSVQISGRLSNLGMTRILHFEMKSEELRKVAKSYGGTVTAYLLSLIMLSAKKCCKEQGMFNVQVPVNMRKYNGSKTLRNYAMYFNASCVLNDISDRYALVEDIGKQIKEKGSEQVMNQMMKTTGGIINKLSKVPLFLKVWIIQMVYGYFSNSMIGCTLSNLGVVEVPENMEKYIDDFLFLLQPGRPNRYSSTLISFKDKTVFTLSKNCRQSAFEEEIYRLLKEDGIAVEVKGSVDYEY